MNRLCLGLLSVVVAMTGCSGGNWNWNDTDWDTAAPRIERFVELATRIAFAREDVKEYKPEVCEVVSHVVGVLNDYDDPDATFSKLRELAISALDDLSLDPEIKCIVALVLDQVLDVAFIYAKESYLDLINQDTSKAVITIGKAVSTGLNNACVEESLRTFHVDKM